MWWAAMMLEQHLDAATGDAAEAVVRDEGRRIAWAARRHEPAHGEPRWTRPAWAVTAALIVLGVWWALAASHAWSELILPSPAKVWRAFVQSVTTHDGRRGVAGFYLWQHLWASLQRILQGLVRGILLGVPLGLVLGTWRRFELLVEPIVAFVRSLPPLGYFSLLIIWFGIGDRSKVWLLFLAAFAPISLAVASGVASLRTERIDAALVLGAGRWQLVRHTVLPSVLPDLLVGIRVAVGFAWTTIVAAETSNGIPGIGGLAWSTKKELRADIAILCVIVIGLTAVLLDAALRALERRLVPWKGRA